MGAEVPRIAHDGSPANLGQYTLLASAIVGPSGHVHAFQPEPVTFRWLARNVALNRLANVSLVEAALSDVDGTRTLHVSTVANLGASSLAPLAAGASGASPIRCVPMATYASAANVSHVGLVKIDVEGAELLVLRGADALLRAEHAPLIVMEFNERHLAAFDTSSAAVAAFLRDRGYTLLSIRVPERQRSRRTFFNALAVPPGARRWRSSTRLPLSSSPSPELLRRERAKEP